MKLPYRPIIVLASAAHKVWKCTCEVHVTLSPEMACAASQPGGYFSVRPKTDCPHVQVVKQTDSLNIDISAPCQTCGNIGENWLCLVCSEVHCSRYVKEHMVQHNENTSHPITLSFTDLSFWCYECDSYITSPLLKGILKAAELAKFDSQEAPTTS